KWTEYPPDANHGVYVDAAVISIKLPSVQNVTILPNSVTSTTYYSPNVCFIRIHTESLLVSLATPDFSMPYNVICLVSTVVSLAFGPIHNLTTRRAQIPKKEDEASKKSIITRIKNFFSRKKEKKE
ncbi:GPI transamidase component PIG-T-like protein, partial [Leptotrombidium deliense]